MRTATAEPALIGWRFFFGWVVWTVVGSIAGFILGFVLAEILAHGLDRRLLGGLALTGCIGAGVGGMQSMMLRSVSVERSGGWVLASVVGLTAGLGLFQWVAVGVWGLSVEGVLGQALALTVGGTLIGSLQWPILRTQVKRSAWWVPASAVGWGSCVFAEIAAPILLGTVTGGVLAWLLRQPKPHEAN
jgi:hypothetical protein